VTLSAPSAAHPAPAAHRATATPRIAAVRSLWTSTTPRGPCTACCAKRGATTRVATGLWAGAGRMARKA